jgi:hypothetical protein
MAGSDDVSRKPEISRQAARRAPAITPTDGLPDAEAATRGSRVGGVADRAVVVLSRRRTRK